MPLRFLLSLALCCSIAVNLRAGVFDTLRTVPKEKQIEVAGALFKKRLILLDSTTAFAELDAFLEQAVKSRDRQLQAIALMYKGQYYSSKFKKKQEQALHLLREALAIAESTELTTLLPNIIHRIGLVYYSIPNYPLAFEHFLKADGIMQEVGYEHIPNASAMLRNMGINYLEFKNFDRAKHYYKAAIKYANEKDNETRYVAYNQLGAYFAELQKRDSSLYYFRRALHYATESADMNAIGTTTGNIGKEFYRQGNYAAARLHLDKAYEACMQAGNVASAALILPTLTRIDMVENNIGAALQKVGIMHDLLTREGLSHNERLQLPYYRVLADIYRKQNNLPLAYTYLDSFITLKDSLYIYKDISIISNLEAQHMTAKHLADLQVLENEKRIQGVIRNSVIVVSLLLLLFSVRTIYHLRAKRRKEQKISLLERQKVELQKNKIELEKNKAELEKNKMELEKSKLDIELQHAHATLKSFMENMREKNRLIQNVEAEVDRLKNISGPGMAEHQNEIIEKLSQTRILTDNDWKRFRKMFDKAYPGFLQRLNVRYEHLTQGDIRLLALIKLDLAIDEISVMTGVSLDAVRRASQRVRNKLNIPNIEGLNDLVENI